jgi:hypothetical protein
MTNLEKRETNDVSLFSPLRGKIRLSIIAFFLGLWYNIIGDANELY